jgi:TonB family protein
MPPLPQGLAAAAVATGRVRVVEVVIDENGRVESAVIRQSLHTVYDAAVLSQTRQWRYRPATREGVPVKYRKMIQFVIEGR